MGSCSAIVLAGGRATRLGGVNKAQLEVGGRRILDRVLDALRPLTDQIIVVGHLAQGAPLAGIHVVPDALPVGGSMVGIYTGLSAATSDTALVVGCDMPFLSTPLLRRILELSEGYDLAVPRVGPHLEALHAAYSRSCLPVIEKAMSHGNLKIIDFYPMVKVREVPEPELRRWDPELRSFLNVNTPGDLERARSIALIPEREPADL